MVDLSFDPATGRLCGDLAVDMLSRLGTLASEIRQPSSFRYYLTASVGEAVLVLAALLCQTTSRTNLGDRYSTFVQSLFDGRSILSSLASRLVTARRMSDRLAAILGLVEPLLSSDFDMNGPAVAEIQSGMHELFESGLQQDQLGPTSSMEGTIDEFALDGFAAFDSGMVDPFSEVYNIDFM